MKILLDEVEELGNGIWFTLVPSHQLSLIGPPKAIRGRSSVLLAASPSFDRGKKQLVLKSEDIVVLNIGTSPRTVVVDTIISAEALTRQDDTPEPQNLNRGPGDQEFLALAERELHGDALTLAERLLHEVRERWPGDLQRGARNNFSNTPDNFWYVIIQPRVQGLSITIRGRPERFSSEPLELRNDRPGYTRFTLKSSAEVPAAINLIEQSKKKTTDK